jgi:hypothetical protein
VQLCGSRHNLLDSWQVNLVGEARSEQQSDVAARVSGDAQGLKHGHSVLPRNALSRHVRA